jgi:hypothetical protein
MKFESPFWVQVQGYVVGKETNERV